MAGQGSSRKDLNIYIKAKLKKSQKDISSEISDLQQTINDIGKSIKVQAKLGWTKNGKENSLSSQIKKMQETVDTLQNIKIGIDFDWNKGDISNLVTDIQKEFNNNKIKIGAEIDPSIAKEQEKIAEGNKKIQDSSKKTKEAHEDNANSAKKAFETIKNYSPEVMKEFEKHQNKLKETKKLEKDLEESRVKAYNKAEERWKKEYKNKNILAKMEEKRVKIPRKKDNEEIFKMAREDDRHKKLFRGRSTKNTIELNDFLKQEKISLEDFKKELKKGFPKFDITAKFDDKELARMQKSYNDILNDIERTQKELENMTSDLNKKALNEAKKITNEIEKQNQEYEKQGKLRRDAVYGDHQQRKTYYDAEGKETGSTDTYLDRDSNKKHTVRKDADGQEESRVTASNYQELQNRRNRLSKQAEKMYKSISATGEEKDSLDSILKDIASSKTISQLDSLNDELEDMKKNLDFKDAKNSLSSELEKIRKTGSATNEELDDIGRQIDTSKDISQLKRLGREMAKVNYQSKLATKADSAEDAVRSLKRMKDVLGSKIPRSQMNAVDEAVNRMRKEKTKQNIDNVTSQVKDVEKLLNPKDKLKLRIEKLEANDLIGDNTIKMLKNMLNSITDSVSVKELDKTLVSMEQVEAERKRAKEVEKWRKELKNGLEGAIEEGADLNGELKEYLNILDKVDDDDSFKYIRSEIDKTVSDYNKLNKVAESVNDSIRRKGKSDEEFYTKTLTSERNKERNRVLEERRKLASGRNSSRSQLKEYYNDGLLDERQFKDLSRKIGSITDTDGFKDLNKEMKEAISTEENLRKEREKNVDKLKELERAGQITTEQFNRLADENKRASDVFDTFAVGEHIKETKKFNNAQKELRDTLENLHNVNKKFSTTEFTDFLNRIDSASTVKDIKRIRAEMNEAKKQAVNGGTQRSTRDIGKINGFTDIQNVNERNVVEAIKRGNQALRNREVISSEVDRATGKWSVTLRDAGNRERTLRGEIDQTNGSLQQHQERFRTTASANLGIIEQFKIALQRVPVWMGAMTVFYGTQHALQDMLNTIIEVDAQMTELKRVMSEDTDFNAMLEGAVQLSNELGNNLADVNQSMIGFARQGFKGEDALDMARTATVASNVSELTADQSMENLTAIMTQFNIEASESIQIIDKLNEVDNNFAITTKNLSDAVSKAGATAQTFNVSLDKMIGHVTAVGVATRESGSVVGNSLKSIYSRLTTMEGSVNALENIGISIKSTTGEMKSSADVLDELYSKWGDLNSEQRQNLGVQIAGRYQLSR